VIDATLTDVNAAVAAQPKIIRFSGFVIPPGIGDTVDLKWCGDTIVLHQSKDPLN
jgi:hypothetical protein